MKKSKRPRRLKIPRVVRRGLNRRQRAPATEVFNLRIDLVTLAKLRLQAERERRPMTSLVRILLEEGLEQRRAS